ncbi:MAG: hypothetical protein NTV86_16075 [Planctomycetota bacterium]|nr:hypothetical protein [Planctomycetota bacterium]
MTTLGSVGAVILLLALAFAPAAAQDKAPALTGSAQPLAEKSVTLQAGDLEAVVVGNDTLDGHGGGYNGIAKLVHKREGRPLFIPFYSGINFEHIFDGRDAGFAPRGGRLTLWRFGPQSVGIYCPPDQSPWGLESMTRITLVAPHYIDLEFTAVPRKASYAGDYIGMFWASYINGPRDRSICFLGRDKGDESSPARWITALSPAHDVRSTHVARFEPKVWKTVDSRKWPGLAANVSDYEFDAPFYFGRCREMAWVYMFDRQCICETQTLRFSQSPVGGGDLNPAWDFHVVVRPFKVDQAFSWRARCLYKPYAGAADILKEYLQWSGRTDLKAPAVEPKPGEQLPPESVRRTVKSLSGPIRVSSTGFGWFKLARPLTKGPGESVGIWFDAGKSGGANRYSKTKTHWVYWAVDLKDPQVGRPLDMGRYGYPIITGYRKSDAAGAHRQETGGGEDGTSTGLVFDPMQQEASAGEITEVYWYGYEGQTIRAAILSAPMAE